jgi:hypothetical protein
VRADDVLVHLPRQRIDWPAALIVLLWWFTRIRFAFPLNDIVVGRAALSHL